MSWRRAFALAAIVIWLLASAGYGVNTWFTDDDISNFHGAISKPAGELEKQTVFFFTGGERAFVNLLYRWGWNAIGFHPLVYRFICFVLLLLNLVLAYFLFFELSESEGVALLGAFLFAYHPSLTDLYLSSATLYDIVCFLLYFAALMIYLRVRKVGRTPTWRVTLAICVLTGLALGSKEMAVTLPVMFACTELLYGDRKHWRTTLLVCGIVALFVAGRLWAPGAQASNAAYRADLTPRTLIEHWGHYLYLISYGRHEWKAWETLALLGAFCGAALIWRRRELLWAAALMVVAPIPVLAIDPRNLYAMYLALPSLCLLAAALFVTPFRRFQLPVAVAISLAFVIWIRPINIRQIYWTDRWYYEQEARLKQAGEVVRTQLPPLRRGANLYFVDDPYGRPGEDGTYVLVMLARLLNNDPTIEVLRARAMTEALPESDWPNYDGVYRLTKSKLERLR